ncbi:MAG: histidine kinase [Anaerocolumna sp.]
MLRHIKKYFADFGLRYKILFCILFISTTCLLFIGFLCYTHFSKIIETDAIENTTYTLKTGLDGFNQNLNSILKNTNKFVSKSSINAIISHIVNSDSKKYITDYNNIQSPLNNLIQSHEWIDSVALIGKNGEFYSSSDFGWNYDVSVLWDLKPLSKEGIQVLPVVKNPLTNLNQVIPVIIPITTMNESLPPLIGGTIESSDATLLLFLKASMIKLNFEQVNKNSEAVIYLCSQDGEPVNLVNSSVAASENVKSVVASSDSIRSVKSVINRNTYLVSSYGAGAYGLKVVSLIEEHQLLKNLYALKSFVLFAWGIDFILSVLLSFILSNFVTRPLSKLMNTVQQIEYGTYESRLQLDSKDEVGKLCNAINSMYETINLQIATIKREEAEKTKAEIHVLSEQINPHFMYNTLDCIHWEILSDHKDRAALMIESLGEFLRIGLSYGNTITSLEYEIKHIENYIAIMNLRCNQPIRFTCHMDPALSSYPVVKLILQPLVENSIKHGFDDFDMTSMGLVPNITVEVLSSDINISITVSDNGKGIDLKKASLALNNGTSSRHVGLNNIMKRLNAYYGEEVSIRFYTIPFFKNSVVLTLPHKKEQTAESGITK